MEWLKQTDSALFPDIEWSKPENKLHAGKLLIIAGSSHGFAAAAEAFEHANQAGAGQIKILLPDKLKDLLIKMGGISILEYCDFAPSTPSGSFSKKALASCLDYANWADSVLIAGNLDRNSETAVMLESFSEKFNGQLTIAKDGLDYFIKKPPEIIKRESTVLVGSFAQLSQLLMAARSKQPLKYDMQLINIVEMVCGFSDINKPAIITLHQDQLIISYNGYTSTTQVSFEEASWRVKTAAAASVYLMQNPNKPFEALTTAAFRFSDKKNYD